ncbi:MAG: CatB-related O-acetyltransferase [Bacteroidaceae bacterium]|nr:CatB-related O-acetyltransferase [Bacteroidaceae bacterium]
MIMKFFREIFERFKYRKQVRLSLTSRSISTEYEGYNAVFSHAVVKNCKIGMGTYVGEHSSLNSVRIGRFCSIAGNVHTVLGNHPVAFGTTHPAFYYDTTGQLGYTFHSDKEPLFDSIYKFPDGEDRYQIVIGNDVWIGSHVKIMGGVNIGDGAVIAAGAVVTKDVEPYSIVGGVPAKLIRKRFSDDQINFLLDLRWWAKPFDDIRANYRKYLEILTSYETEKDIEENFEHAGLSVE